MAVAVAKGIHDHPKFKLGSITGSGKQNPKTLTLSDFVPDTATSPPVWDFDKGRKPFPRNVWGNNDYGDCECAGAANYMIRQQRAQVKGLTPGIDDNDVIARYKKITGCVSPGDNNDTGMTTLDNLNDWRSGWEITKDWQTGGEQTRSYHISAYGLVDQTNEQLLRTCMYLFQGCLFGIELPITAQAQTENNEPWDVVDPSLSGDSAPGSWGGHCVYGKKYDQTNIYILTWGMEVEVTPAFKSAYFVEAYSVIDSFDTWFNFPHSLNVQGMIDKMKSLGINVG